MGKKKTTTAAGNDESEGHPMFPLSQFDVAAAKSTSLLLKRNLTQAETQLLELFQQKENELKRREAERIAMSKIMKGTSSITSVKPGAISNTKGAAPVAASITKSVAPAPAPAPAQAPASRIPAKPTQSTPALSASTSANALALSSSSSSSSLSTAAAARVAAEILVAAAGKRRLEESQAGATVAETEAGEGGAIDEPSAADEDATGAALLPMSKIRKREKQEEVEVVDRPESVVSSVFTNKPGLLPNASWNPRTSKGSAFFALDGFGLPDGALDAEEAASLNQTLVLLLKIPQGAKQWAINICPENHLDNHNIFLHLNVRYAAGKQLRKELVLNDREGTWGVTYKESLESGTSEGTRALLAGTIELSIQIRREGYVIFANGKFVSLFLHRRELPREGSPLILSFPLTDDMAKLQEGEIEKVWWGHLSPGLFDIPQDVLFTDGMAHQRDVVRDLSNRPCSLRTVIVTGLPTHTSPKELQFIEESLKTVFGVKEIEPESISVVPGRGLAYVRLRNKEEALVALQLQRYKIEDTEGAKFKLTLAPFEKPSVEA